MKYVTIKDIAAELGISKSTVSRALNGDTRNVSASTLKQIVDMAARMGYRRNEMAVNLRSKSNHIIGIVVPELNTPFSMMFISEAQKFLMEQGYSVTMTISNEDPAIERQNLEMLDVKMRVDGILISPAHSTANLDLYENFLLRRIPLVFFDRTPVRLDVPCVKSNDYIKSFFLVESMIYNGKRKILHLSGPDHIQNAVDRRKGWRDALDKFHIGYDASYCINVGVGLDDGYHAIEDAMAKGIEFDGVFCFTETQALGAKRCLQEHQLHIPRDVAICSMSGTVLSTLVHPQITTAEQQILEMARIATGLLIDKINDFACPNKTIVLDAKIVNRRSTEKA